MLPCGPCGTQGIRMAESDAAEAIADAHRTCAFGINTSDCRSATDDRLSGNGRTTRSGGQAKNGRSTKNGGATKNGGPTEAACSVLHLIFARCVQTFVE